MLTALAAAVRWSWCRSSPSSSSGRTSSPPRREPAAARDGRRAERAGRPEQLAATPTGALGAGDIRLALLYANGLAQSARGRGDGAAAGRRGAGGGPRRGASRRCGRRPTAGRSTGWWPSAAGEGRALVIGQRLDATRAVLTRLGDRAADDRRGRRRAGRARRGRRGPRRPAAGAAADRGDRAGRGDRRAAARSPSTARTSWPGSPHSFNDMLGALAASQEQQRRLVADAGHELRTPLTSMRTNLELLAAAARPGRPAAARVGPRGDPRRRAGPGRGAVDAGGRPGRAGARGRPAGRARAAGAHRRRRPGPGAGPAPGRRRRVHRRRSCRGR